MKTSYIKHKSGYCYQVQDDKKVRISKDEYNKQVKQIHKKHGGQRQSNKSDKSDSIHSTNVNEKQTISYCKQKCNNDRIYTNLKQKMVCIDDCRLNNKSSDLNNKSSDRLPTPTSMFTQRKTYQM
jgi:hypothetical protein